VFELRRRYDSAEALERFVDWLDSAPHRSKGLTGPDRARVRASRVKSARGDLAKLDLRGMNRQSGPAAAPFPLLALPPALSPFSDSGPRWREDLLAALSADDRTWIAGVEVDPKWRARLGVLLAAVRRVQRDEPDASAVAVPRAVLKRISANHSHVDPTTGEVKAGYVMLRDKSCRPRPRRTWSRSAKRSSTP
jgi:hypothetical protein